MMENKMETTIVYWGYLRDNGKENGNYYSIIGYILGLDNESHGTKGLSSDMPGKLPMALLGR